jgi:DNA processing protein
MAERIDALELEVCTRDELPGVFAADHDPPGVLFTSGSEIDAQGARVAIVGTRRASDYGLRMARLLGHDLAEAGVGVVSGLALGIDAAAHAGALEAPGETPPVVAVIGAGHHRPCPSRNRGLARAVTAAGSVISEVPPGIPSAPWRYPVRNRLIATLADVVVVVESASSGGSMSTVAEALARDRVVMAVPGLVGRRAAEGCHDLLRDGAEICTGADDVVSILGLLGFSPTTEREAGQQDAGADVNAAPGVDEAVVLELLADGPRTMDSLLSAGGFDLVELSSVLAAMEAGSLVATDAGWVRRVR